MNLNNKRDTIITKKITNINRKRLKSNRHIIINNSQSPNM